MCASQRLVLSGNGSGNRRLADARLTMAPATSLDMNSVAPFIQLKQQCFSHFTFIAPTTTSHCNEQSSTTMNQVDITTLILAQAM